MLYSSERLNQDIFLNFFTLWEVFVFLTVEANRYSVLITNVKCFNQPALKSTETTV